MKQISVNVIGILLMFGIAGCGGGSGGGGSSTTTYTVGGNVNGLSAGQSVTLQNNGLDDLILTMDGVFGFATQLADGDTYNVQVSTQPSTQTCSASTNSGSIAAASISNVVITCSTNTYTVGGSLSGLAALQSIVLTNNGGDNLTLSANGAFTFNTAVSDSAGYDVQIATQPGGQFCIASNNNGTINGANVSNLTVACSASSMSGSLDTTFNALGSTPGIVTNDPDGNTVGSDLGYAIATDSNGKIVVAGDGFSGSTVSIDMTIWRFNSDGSLDTSFDGDGIVTFDGAVGNVQDHGRDLTLDAAGKILVTGESISAATGFLDMVLWRYNSDGTPDTSFGVNGIATHRNAAGGDLSDWGHGITIDASGRILISGRSHNGANDDMVIWRYDSNGILDTNFNTTGFVIGRDASGVVGNDLGYGITVDASGRILVTGQSSTNTGPGMVIWRFNSDGTPDTTFDGDGIVLYQSSAVATSTDEGRAIAVRADGKIIIGGSSNGGGTNFDLAIWRYNADGSIDSTFAAGGPTPGKYRRSVSSSGTQSDVGIDMVVDSNDNILLTGWTDNSTTNNDMILIRVNADGDLDTSFNASGTIPGIVTHHNAAGGNLLDQGQGVTIDISGNILVTGTSTATGTNNGEMTIWRFKP